ncbi:MAG TPA: TonB-dependent receptor [Myxococcales bacterium]|nr:TonB-dependent receptor [Myxococcales bacterium]
MALADARIEAKRHFQKGMGLIARGSFDEGIGELREAYAIKPHPNVLYNIARAYLDAGRVKEATEYYRRYLAANPADSAQVKATVARLEETLRAKEASESPPPPGPGSPQTRASLPMPPPPGGGAALDAESLKKLNDLMARLESAVTKAEAVAAATGAGPAEPAAGGKSNEPLEVAPLASAEPLQEGTTAESRPYEETVVTASRRAQSTLEAPNATTVITSDEIRLSGATSIVDLLRRVPGADVMSMGVGSTNVSFRGFNQRLSNKVLVLLDGRTEYQDFLGLTVWPAIPVGLEEIDRIEVIRGPGSALYGANAMLGVINIITKRPGAGQRSELSAIGGTGDTGGVSYVAYGSDAALRYRASAAFSQEDKWSRDFADDRPDIASRVPDSSLGLRTARANLTTTLALSRGIEVGASGGVNRLYTEFYPLGLLRNFYFDGLGAYAKADVSVSDFKVKLFWNHLDTKAGPQYTPIGQRQIDTSLVSNVLDAEALWSRELSLFGQHKLQVGAELRNKRILWSYLTTNPSELHYAGYVQDEWRVIQPVVVLASYRIDRHPLLNDGQAGYAHSPRFSVVWTPVEGHAVRASWATAFREPTLLENYTEIRIPLPGINGASALTVGNRNLKPESLLAYELGYRGEFTPLGLEWDLSLYQNEVRDLIDVSPLVRMAADQSFDPVTQTYLLGQSTFQNEEGLFTARGAELGVKWAPVDGLDLASSLAVESISQSEVSDPNAACAPCSAVPAFKAYASATYRTKVGFDFSADAFFNTGTTWIEREPSPADPTQILFSPYPLQPYAVINARVGYKFLDDKVHVGLIGTNLGPVHAEHPFGNRISQRFFATISVTP